MPETVQLPLRLPCDVKKWLELQAKSNGSSQNSEVVRALREKMERAAAGSNINN